MKRWNDNVGRGSRVTADVYLRRLGAFCLANGTTPEKLASSSEREAYNVLLDFVTKEEARDLAGSYIQTTVKVVKSWLAHNDIHIKRAIKVKGAQDTPTLRDERVPTPDELRRIFLAATSRDRVACALMAHAGLRPEVLGNYFGTDGLTIVDLPDLTVKESKVEFGVVPAMVVVRPELSKAGHKYLTFLSEEGCGYLKDYLEERLRQGEKLDGGSDLLAPQRANKRFIRTINIGDGIRKAIRAAGFRWRPYVLRAYFDTQLLLAESKGKVAHDYRVFWMGHKGSMEARYTTNKGRLPKAMVDDMREAYGRCEPFLSTVPTKQKANADANVAKVMLIGLGYTEEALAKVDFDDLDPKQFQELVRKKMAAPGASAPKQRVVGLEDVPRLLEQGWTVAMALNHSQAVLNPPSFGLK